MIVLSGCSILFLSILKIVSFRYSFQLALSWQGFQNDLFKRSSQVVLVGWSFLELHPFSCIARRHSSTYIYKEIGLRRFAVFALDVDSGGLSRLSQGLPRQVFQERSPKACPRTPKAPPRLAKAPPRSPKASPRPPQGVPRGSARAFQKAPKDFFKIRGKFWKNNGFSIIFGSMLVSRWP